jgi:thioredoxin reductase (NADPH)
MPDKDSGKIRDVIIIGGGPAGLTAGLYLSRSGLDTLMMESMEVMGQASMTDRIENYPGLKSISGFELLDKMKEQCASFGTEIEQCTARGISPAEDDSGYWKVSVDGGERLSRSVILACGAKPRKLGVNGEDKYSGSGVSYCATCDGPFFRDKKVAVIGGGDAAVEEALFLTKFASKVVIIHRRSRLRASRVLQERAFAEKKIDIIWDSVVHEVRGDGTKVQDLLLRNVNNEKKDSLECDGVFIFIGWEPNTAFLGNVVDLDDKGRVVTDSGMRTSADGVFACGDCSDIIFNQIITACGSGAIASYSAGHYVEKAKGTAYE